LGTRTHVNSTVGKFKFSSIKYLKLFKLVIGLLILATLQYSCAITPQKPSSKGDESFAKKSPGRIVFDQEIHNFGSLIDGEIVSYSFIFRNTGGSSFYLVKGEKSCGCIDIRYNSNEILPGDSSTVELIFNSSGEWGNIIKGVVIETSLGERKELHIGAYIDNKQINNLLNTQK
jgi:Protein of unknown function (DUF1573)